MKNHCLAQAMSDVSLGAFYTMLEYKANWNDRQFVKIDRFFPSSKACSSCGWIKQDLTLSIREWTCESCGEIHDRDVNAAKNILIDDETKMAGSYPLDYDFKTNKVVYLVGMSVPPVMTAQIAKQVYEQWLSKI